MIAAEDVLREATADAPENSLERPVVEFYDFQDYAVPETDRKLHNLEFFLSLRGQGSAGDRIRALPGNIAPAFAAEGEYLQGRKRLLRGDSAAVTKDYFERALKLDPNNEDVRHHIYGHVMQTVRNLMGEDRYADAEPYLRQAVELQSILKVDPGDAGALFSLAHLEAARRSFETALELLERAYAVAPRQPEVIDSYAWLSYLMQDLATARRVVEQGGLYYEGHAYFEQRRRTILAAEKAATP